MDQEKHATKMATRRLSGNIMIDDDEAEQSEMDPFKQDNKYGSVL